MFSFIFRGDDFRKDFKGLSCLKAMFPESPTLVLTATAPAQLLTKLKESLSLKKGCKVIRKNPNRPNIFLDRRRRLSNSRGYESYAAILTPIAEGLLREYTNYPLTIIYMKLKYCGYAYALFDNILGKKQFDGLDNAPCSRLFAQFHSPQTRKMKEAIINEIKKEHSRIRVIFATTALGMGVDAPYVTHVIHIGPSSNLESYFQEIGRAGRCEGKQARATLYFNNSDVADNKTVDDAMKRYCQSDGVCLRNIILEYFGFANSIIQKRCCCVCDGSVNDVSVDTTKEVKVRKLSATQTPMLYAEIQKIILECGQNLADSYSVLYSPMSLPPASDIIEAAEYILNEADLLNKYDIYDELCASKIICLLDIYAPIK